MMTIDRTKRVAHLLVSCNIEKTRFEALKVVVAALKNEMRDKNVDITHNLWVFDNASTEEGSDEFLKESFERCTIFKAEKNYGFWSAINWFLKFLDQNHKGEYDYIHIIESDSVFFALEKIITCEEALNKYPHIGSMRCQEFIAHLSHLYDKDDQRPSSRTYAWVRQRDWDGTKITFELRDSGMQLFESKLVPLLHSMNRLEAMNYAFENLEKQETLCEQDFQKFYRHKYPLSGFIDGGLFHTKLSWQTDVISGSWSTEEKRNNVGYRNTRNDSIVSLSEMKVESL